MVMDIEHVTPPTNSIAAMLAIARLDDATVRHLRECPRCRIAWYRAGAFRAGCTDPRMGVVVMGSIGRAPLPDAARKHIEGCLACRLLALEAARAMDARGAGI
jgi:predicted anti-sigma-YlaC factor YlaD